MAYGYADGNPHRYVDPDGNMNLPASVIGTAVGIAFGFASEVVNQGANALSGGHFDWDEVITSTAAKGLGGLVSGFTGNLAAGGAVSEVYREYIEATSKGENYSLTARAG